MGKITAAITGVGQYLPEYILTNDELSRMVDTNDEWIMSHTGIKTRHILKGEGIGSSYMGARAVINLLDKTGVDPMEIDVVICATVTPDMFFPSTGNLIADQAGCKNAFAFDVSAACSGFLFALTTGAKFIEAGTSKKVIVVGADKMSSIINYNDRNTCPIFGDGAAAVLLEPSEEGYGVLDAVLHSDGGGGQHLYMKAGGSAYPIPAASASRINWNPSNSLGKTEGDECTCKSYAPFRSSSAFLFASSSVIILLSTPFPFDRLFESIPRFSFFIPILTPGICLCKTSIHRVDTIPSLFSALSFCFCICFC